ncbi:MAG: hypothetical protein EOP11_01820 [Proteobacteria bacterium]|nr:MAG: hypothetical protein EOP11_01820 [Pseudomonadota bacterium]
MNTRRLLIFSLALASCAAGPRPHHAGDAPNLAPAPAPLTENLPGAKMVEIEVEGSSRDESRRPYQLGLSGGAVPSLREDEALRMVSAALNQEGFIPGLAGDGVRPLRIKAKFTKEAAGFALFGGGARHALHLEAFDGERLLWEFHASGGSAQDDIRPILPTLLAAGRGLIGASTAGKKMISLAEQRPLNSPGVVPSVPIGPAKKSARRGLLQQ